jgi:hypothetical protein
MKHYLLFLAIVISALTAHAQWWWDDPNYPPDDEDVQLEQTNLPIVWIEVDGATIDRDERITARMKIIHNGEGQLNYADTIAHPGQNIDYEGYIALRYRGNSSFSSSDKKPYSFRTLKVPLEQGGEKEKVKILGMGKDNNWALLAPFNDKSMMRDMLAFELARPWMDYVPKGKFCEMFLDGIYYGVFIMCEVVSKGKTRLGLEDPGETGDELSGGYLLEVDRTDEITYTSKYHPVTSMGGRLGNRYINYQFKEPEYEDLTQAQYDYITGQVDKMEDALASNDFADPEVGYRKYLDEMSFVDYQLSQELAHNVDGYRLSAKIFKRRDSEDPRFKMALWDFNIAYGNSDYYNGWYTTGWVWQNNDVLNWNNDEQLVPFWWYKLNKDPYYTALLKQRWAQYRRSNCRDDRIIATIDSMYNELTVQGAEARNTQAWPRWGYYVWPNYYIAQDFDDEVSHLKQWVTSRVAWIDSQLGFDPSAVVVGDVNGDGVVNSADVTALYGFILNGDTRFIDTSDVNGDTVVNSADVTAVYNIIMGK